MGSLLAYSGISTKIRSMRSQLLQEENYEQMAVMSSVMEAVEYLRQKPSFAAAFSIVQEQTMHRSTVERLLFFTEYYDFIKIYRFSGAEVRKYLNLYFANFERTFLKSAYRKIVDGRESALLIEGLGDFFRKHASFDCDKVADAKTESEFVEALYGSPYYAWLHPLVSQGAMSLYDCEMAIDSYIFINMWKKQKKYFTGDELHTLCRTYGCQLDLLNLMWIYRSKKYYDLDRAELYQILLPVHYKVSKEKIRQMVEAVDIKEFQSLLNQTYYGEKYGTGIELDENGFYIERIYHALLYYMHKREFVRHPFSVAAVSSYLYMKHLETERLVTAIEGVRYGLPPQMILEHEKNYNLEVLNK